MYHSEMRKMKAGYRANNILDLNDRKSKILHSK